MNSESSNSWRGNELDSKKRVLLLRAVIKGFYIRQSIETGVTRHFTESLLTRAEWGVRRSRPLVKFYHCSSLSYFLVLKLGNEEKTQNTFKPGLSDKKNMYQEARRYMKCSNIYKYHATQKIVFVIKIQINLFFIPSHAVMIIQT